MPTIHSKEIPTGMLKGTYFISGVAYRSLPYQLCCLWRRFLFPFSSLILNVKPRAVDLHLPTGKLSAVNDSVIELLEASK